MSKPNGDAVGNGALLSASELHACGHFVNSPSDATPILTIKTKNDNNNLKNKSYRPLKHSDVLDNEAPESIYASDGEEIMSETEYGCEQVSRLVAKTIHSEGPILKCLVSKRKGKQKENARQTTN